MTHIIVYLKYFNVYFELTDRQETERGLKAAYIQSSNSSTLIIFKSIMFFSTFAF